MALNTLKCNLLTLWHFKGLNESNETGSNYLQTQGEY